MLDLNEIRKEIDGTDREIVRLFEERMKLTGKVAEYKIGAGKPVFDGDRERSKLETLGAMASDSFNKRRSRNFFSRSCPSAENGSISCLQRAEEPTKCPGPAIYRWMNFRLRMRRWCSREWKVRTVLPR